MFAPWAERLAETAELRTGDRVLDLACGTGIVARLAAPQVGEEGSVVGVDLNEAMLEVARGASAGVRPSIEWRLGDATDLAFDDASFDVIFCQQALQFVQDPAKALQEIRRVLLPDGRLAASVWRPIEFNPAYVGVADALERHVDDEAATTMRSPFPAWDTDELRASVRDAGFADVAVTIEVGSMRYPSVEAFLRREAASSPLAGPLGSMPPEVRDGLLADLDDALAAYTDDRGITFPMEAHVAVARR